MWLGSHTKDKGITTAEYQPTSRQDQALAHPRQVLQVDLRHESLLDKNKVKT
jgi:hypothetical protein